MFLERLIIIVPRAHAEGDHGCSPTTRTAQVQWRWTLIVGSIALVALLLMLFSKFFPLIPIWEEKEGQKLIDEIKVGDRVVPALVKEH